MESLPAEGTDEHDSFYDSFLFGTAVVEGVRAVECTAASSSAASVVTSAVLGEEEGGLLNTVQVPSVVQDECVTEVLAVERTVASDSTPSAAPSAVGKEGVSVLSEPCPRPHPSTATQAQDESAAEALLAVECTVTSASTSSSTPSVTPSAVFGEPSQSSAHQTQDESAAEALLAVERTVTSASSASAISASAVEISLLSEGSYPEPHSAVSQGCAEARDESAAEALLAVERTATSASTSSATSNASVVTAAVFGEEARPVPHPSPCATSQDESTAAVLCTLGGGGLREVERTATTSSASATSTSAVFGEEGVSVLSEPCPIPHPSTATQAQDESTAEALLAVERTATSASTSSSTPSVTPSAVFGEPSQSSAHQTQDESAAEALLAVERTVTSASSASVTSTSAVFGERTSLLSSPHTSTHDDSTVAALLAAERTTPSATSSPTVLSEPHSAPHLTSQPQADASALCTPHPASHTHTHTHHPRPVALMPVTSSTSTTSTSSSSSSASTMTTLSATSQPSPTRRIHQASRVHSCDMLEALWWGDGGGGGGGGGGNETTETEHGTLERTESCDLQTPSSAMCAAEAAAQHAECAVCFDPLCQGQAVVFVNSARLRVCRHYFHEECVTDLRPDSQEIFRCPLCRTPFTIIFKMPDPRVDPKEWFRLTSTRSSGTLSRPEVRDVLLATVNTDVQVLESVLDNKWEDWDRNNSGFIEWDTADGLFEFVRMNLPGRRMRPPPDLLRDRGAWFEFFDTEAKGYLSEGKIARGIIKTFTAGGDSSAVVEVSAMVREVFAIFTTTSPVLTSSTTPHACITKEHFIQKDGLADAIIAALMYSGVTLPSYQEEEDKALAVQLQERINGPGSNPEVLSVAPWECPGCTFINPSTSSVCEMCQSARPKKKTEGDGVECGAEGEEQAEEEEEEVTPGWTCAICTFENETATSRQCGMCGAGRGAAGSAELIVRRQQQLERRVQPQGVQNAAPTPPQPAVPIRERPRAVSSAQQSSVAAATARLRNISLPTAGVSAGGRGGGGGGGGVVNPRWEPDTDSTTCRSCATNFSFFVRRHHCRGCGRLYCGSCAPIRRSARAPHREERLCNACLAERTG